MVDTRITVSDEVWDEVQHEKIDRKTETLSKTIEEILKDYFEINDQEGDDNENEE